MKFWKLIIKIKSEIKAVLKKLITKKNIKWWAECECSTPTTLLVQGWKKIKLLNQYLYLKS